MRSIHVRRRDRLGWRPVLLCLAIGAACESQVVRIEAAPVSLSAPETVGSPTLPRKQVLRRALRGDATQEYLLYVPGKGGLGARVFVDVHGISRNVEEHAALFTPYAEKYGVVLVAPSFTKKGHDGYQWLGPEDGGRRADLDLEAILREVHELTGATTARFYLFGFSGGAQFAHRYALAHPDRVAGAAIGAAGWYTFPDSGTAYPYGLAAGSELSGVRFDPQRFLRVPMTVFVGIDDVLGESLRRNPEVDRQQGTTRRERAQRWVAAMRQAAEARGLEPRVACQQVPGIKHSFRQFMLEGDLGARVFEALFGPPAVGGGATGAVAPSAVRGGVR